MTVSRRVLLAVTLSACFALTAGVCAGWLLHKPAAAPAVTAATAPPYGAPDVPAGWTTVDTPDAQALAFRCALSGGQVSVTVWNISAVQEQAWHLTVISYRGPQEAGTGSLDIGANWVQPGQKMTFTRDAYGSATSCKVTGLG